MATRVTANDSLDRAETVCEVELSVVDFKKPNITINALCDKRFLLISFTFAHLVALQSHVLAAISSYSITVLSEP